jgi:hypothetical protein
MMDYTRERGAPGGSTAERSEDYTFVAHVFFSATSREPMGRRSHLNIPSNE